MMGFGTLTMTLLVMAAIVHSSPIEDHIDVADCSKKPVEIAFLVDSSSSVRYRGFSLTKKFLIKLAKHFNIGPDSTRVSVALFGDGVYEGDSIQLSQGNNQWAVLQAIERLRFQYGGRTATDEAIKYMRNTLFAKSTVRPNAKKIGIILTDGLPDDEDQTKQEALLALADDIKIIAIAIGKKLNKEATFPRFPTNDLDWAANENGMAVHVDKFEELDEIVGVVENEICDVLLNKPAP